MVAVKCRVLLLESRRIAGQHIGSVEYPRVEVRVCTALTLLSDHVIPVRPDRELRKVVRNTQLEGVGIKAVCHWVRPSGNCNALHHQWIAYGCQVVRKLADDPAVRKMVIKDIRIPPASNEAIVVRGGARPQGLEIGRPDKDCRSYQKFRMWRSERAGRSSQSERND